MFLFLNTVLIQWFYIKHSTIETSAFGSEFVAMKIFMETLQGIRYKLGMMVVPISGPSYIYGYNMSFICNTQIPESTLKNNISYICYHAVCESVAIGYSLTGHVGTNENCADLSTKLLYAVNRRFCVSNFSTNTYDYL